MNAIIYQPTRNNMQAGKANSAYWLLEFEHNGESKIESLMGWTSSSDMSQEIKLKFSTKEKAIKFANTNNLKYEVYEPEIRKLHKQAYSDNFK